MNRTKGEKTPGSETNTPNRSGVKNKQKKKNACFSNNWTSFNFFQFISVLVNNNTSEEKCSRKWQ